MFRFVDVASRPLNVNQFAISYLALSKTFEGMFSGNSLVFKTTIPESFPAISTTPNKRVKKLPTRCKMLRLFLPLPASGRAYVPP